MDDLNDLIGHSSAEPEEKSDGEEVLELLAAVGGGFVLGTLLYKAAESGVKGDVAKDFADALEKGLGS